jgi:hypothetical protein
MKALSRIALSTLVFAGAASGIEEVKLGYDFTEETGATDCPGVLR